jgi:hypothetical protein
MSAGSSHAAYMRGYRKTKRLEDNCNNVSKITKLNAEQQREYRETHKSMQNVCFWQGEVVRICQSYGQVTLTSTSKMITMLNL